MFPTAYKLTRFCSTGTMWFPKIYTMTPVAFYVKSSVIFFRMFGDFEKWRNTPNVHNLVIGFELL